LYSFSPLRISVTPMGENSTVPSDNSSYQTSKSTSRKITELRNRFASCAAPQFHSTPHQSIGKQNFSRPCSPNVQMPSMPSPIKRANPRQNSSFQSGFGPTYTVRKEPIPRSNLTNDGKRSSPLSNNPPNAVGKTNSCYKFLEQLNRTGFFDSTAGSTFDSSKFTTVSADADNFGENSTMTSVGRSSLTRSSDEPSQTFRDNSGSSANRSPEMSGSGVRSTDASSSGSSPCPTSSTVSGHSILNEDLFGALINWWSSFILTNMNFEGMSINWEQEYLQCLEDIVAAWREKSQICESL
jgi:hypothetical protein